MSPVRVLFAGTPDVALPTLDLLASDQRFVVVGVLTNPDRPRGRSGSAQPSPVASRAMELGLPIIRPERVAEARDAIVHSTAEIGAVVAYGSILPAAILTSLPLGFVNLHFSLLPRWRGAAPVQHAIRAGDRVTGVSAFRLDEGMDTGPVLRTLEVAPPEDVDAGTLLQALAVQGAPVLLDALLAVAAGESGVPQSEVGACAAPRIRADDAVIDWSMPAAEVARLVRSVTPRPGASTTLEGQRLKIARVATRRVYGSPTVPGTVLGVDEDGIAVACGDGQLVIEHLQFAGRAWMAAPDALRGRLLAAGAVLGE